MEKENQILDEMKQIRTALITLTEQVKYLTKLSETAIEESNLGSRKDKHNNNIEDILQIFETSPLAEHPVLKGMLGPLKEIMKKQKV